jgi:hypothetical protein
VSHCIAGLSTPMNAERLSWSTVLAPSCSRLGRGHAVHVLWEDSR